MNAGRRSAFNKLALAEQEAYPYIRGRDERMTLAVLMTIDVVVIENRE